MLEAVLWLILKVFLGVCIAMLILIGFAWLVGKSFGDDGDNDDVEDP